MKKHIFKYPVRLFGLVLAMGMAFIFSACKENIDDSNFAIKTKNTITDHLSERPELSDIKLVFDRVKLGKADNASSLTSVLASRGNYTLFAPTNEAIQKYLAKLGLSSIDQLSDEDAVSLAYNCIIDNGDNEAYELSVFPSNKGDVFDLANLNDRDITCMENEDGIFVLNGTSNVIQESSNVEASNGYLHEIDNVIELSNLGIAGLMMQSPNLQVMANLIEAAGLTKKLEQNRDLEYENKEYPEKMTKIIASDPNHAFKVPQKRYLGFTAFVETDDVFAREWGINIQRNSSDSTISNLDEVLKQIEAKASEVYGSRNEGDYTNPNNALNRFVSYHILPAKMSYDKMVNHGNEYLYKYGADAKNPQNKDYTVEVWNYYTTIGEVPDLLKITQVPDGNHEIYINRVCEYNNEFDGDYQVRRVKKTGHGLNVLINPNNGVYNNNSLNGYFFPINNILIKSKEVEQIMGSERLRIDLTTCLPEIASNNIKGTEYHYFPLGFFDNILNESSGTNKTYLPATSASWTDYQNDEFIFAGLFDFVLRIPPVPQTGTYEIRLGISQNSFRGMAQVYMGQDPFNLKPMGLPLDLRQTVDLANNPSLNWQDDVEDISVNVENDKNLRNQGYMKGPKYYHKNDGQGDPNTVVRLLPYGKSSPCVRRIVGQIYMEANKSYYMRFKSALNQIDAEFFMDYIEYCPSIIYNGATAEDPW